MAKKAAQSRTKKKRKISGKRTIRQKSGVDPRGVAGIVVLCIGSALYMTADLGVSTYDAVAIVMSKKWKWGQFRYVRICTDLACVLLGGLMIYLASGSAGEVAASVGVGTIVTAFFMGPLIEFFNEKIARPILGETKK